VVNFMPPPLYYQEKVPPVPTEKRLGGPQSQSGCPGEESCPYWAKNSK